MIFGWEGFFAPGTRRILPGSGEARLAGRGAVHDFIFAAGQIRIMHGSGEARLARRGAVHDSYFASPPEIIPDGKDLWV